jgi:predicted DCC family thiol-disulfide oxidoreductase YuxK
MISVFYDGKCGLCSREINHYRKISPEGIFDWQDITVSDAGLRKAGIPLSEGLKNLYAMDESGHMHVGVDAFILIWKQLKRWRVLAGIVSMPGINRVTCIAYDKFADWRFNRLAHCQMAAKDDANT